MESLLDSLLQDLLNEQGLKEPIALPSSLEDKRTLFRSLMNQRPPLPLCEDFLRRQDAYLTLCREKKGVVHLSDLRPRSSGFYLWQGDITRLAVDAIVNAANNELLGCFIPCHHCIDNAIHSAAGAQLRQECAQHMSVQGYPEPTGQVTVTKGYNLPSRYVFHTVGPIVLGPVTERHCQELAQCYSSCLQKAIDLGLESLAFCCISTGEYHFPAFLAAQLAVERVKQVLTVQGAKLKVIFNVFTNRDFQLYDSLLDKPSQASQSN